MTASKLLVCLAAMTACGDNLHLRADAAPPDAPACVVRGDHVGFRLIAQTHGAALLVTGPTGDSRAFVVEQEGRIEILENGVLLAHPFLDLSDGPVVCCGEQGLLGLAFSPSYALDRTFYVFYTTDTADVLARYQASDDPDRADPNGAVLLSIPDFAVNHNGGMLEFGPDGYLYIGTGDGGGGGDPMRTAQDPHALLGKVLRLDVSHGSPYAIPPTNPFADGIAGAPEIFMLGTRNPWRWSFDGSDMWIGDVGQDAVEELDLVHLATAAGANLGWSRYEGTSCFRSPCDPTGILMPVFQQLHTQGWCAIIGGSVYRGGCYPDLVGKYFFTDYCKRALGVATTGTSGVAVNFVPSLVVDSPEPARPDFPPTPASLHADGRGELYLTTQTCCGTSLLGGVYHLEAM